MPIYRRKGKFGNTYRVSVMRNGQRISKTFKRRMDAEKFQARLTIDDDFIHSATSHTLNNLTLSKAIKEYFEQYSGRDFVTLNGRLKRWATSFGEHPIGKITKLDVRSFLNSLGLENSTQNRYKAALSAVFSYINEEYDLSHNPASEVKQKLESTKMDRFLSKHELERLFVECKASNWNRLFLLVLLAITTGARKGELINLRWGDIDFEKSSAKLETSKTNKPRLLALMVEAKTQLQKFREVGNGFVFPHESIINAPKKYFDVHWYRAREAAGIKDVRFHDLRHTAASILAENGATLLEIADVLGHNSIQTTQRYAHLCINHKTSLIDRVMGAIK